MIYTRSTVQTTFRVQYNSTYLKNQRMLVTVIKSVETWSSFFMSHIQFSWLAQLYDSEITNIANDMIPVWTVRFIRRSSDPWFDDYYHAAKKRVRHLEREVRRADPADALQQPLHGERNVVPIQTHVERLSGTQKSTPNNRTLGNCGNLSTLW